MPIRKGDRTYRMACENALERLTRALITDNIRGIYPEAVLRGGEQRLVAVSCGGTTRAETWVIRRFIGDELDRSLIIANDKEEWEIHGIMHRILQDVESTAGGD